MGSCFKFGKAALEIFEFEFWSSRKRVIFRQALEGSCIPEIAPKRFLKHFCNFQGTNAYNFAKKTQNLKTRAYFKQNFMELDMKKFSDLKALTFEVGGLWTSLGQFGPKTFCKGFIKPLDENPSFNFQKQDFIFSGIMRWIK